jgi:hypothetical protein
MRSSVLHLKFLQSHILGFLNYFWYFFYFIAQRLKINLITAKISFINTYTVEFLSTWPERNWEESNLALFWSTQRIGLVVTCARFFAQCTLLYDNVYTVKCVKNHEIAATYSSFIKYVWSPSYVGPALVKKHATKFLLIFLWHTQFLSAQLVILYS